MNSQNDLQSQKRQFLEAKATEWGFVGDTRKAFLLRFDESNADQSNEQLATSIKWNNDLVAERIDEWNNELALSNSKEKITNPKKLTVTNGKEKLQLLSQKLQDELMLIYEKFTKIEGCPIQQQGKGRPTGKGRWEKPLLWLWEIEFRKWQNKQSSRMGADAASSEWNGTQLPSEFEPIIREKIREFYGRRFVFEAIESFLNNNPCGYFTVVGYPGMGKSAIAAKYVADNYAICYFNILVEGRNRPQLFLKSICDQLIKRYTLVNIENDNLLHLLTQVSQQLSSTERLVIVVDALDEVEQESRHNENILYLPTALPDRVYFLLTRRPYTLETKRLSVSPRVPVEELNFENYVDQVSKDAENFIFLFLEKENHKDAIRNWIGDREITQENFIKPLLNKSESNPMYLGYVLASIVSGSYKDLTLKQLPNGLLEYYQTHWVRMRINVAPMKVIILFILSRIGTPMLCKTIVDIAQKDEYEVQKVLDEWIEYFPVTIKGVNGENKYSVYHATFLDYLKEKRELKANRNLLQEVDKRIYEYFRRGM